MLNIYNVIKIAAVLVIYGGYLSIATKITFMIIKADKLVKILQRFQDNVNEIGKYAKETYFLEKKKKTTPRLDIINQLIKFSQFISGTNENRRKIYTYANKLVSQIVLLNIWAMGSFVVVIALIPWCFILYHNFIGQLREEHFIYSIAV